MPTTHHTPHAWRPAPPPEVTTTTTTTTEWLRHVGDVDACAEAASAMVGYCLQACDRLRDGVERARMRELLEAADTGVAELCQRVKPLYDMPAAAGLQIQGPEAKATPTPTSTPLGGHHIDTDSHHGADASLNTSRQSHRGRSAPQAQAHYAGNRSSSSLEEIKAMVDGEAAQLSAGLTATANAAMWRKQQQHAQPHAASPTPWADPHASLERQDRGGMEPAHAFTMHPQSAPGRLAGPAASSDTIHTLIGALEHRYQSVMGGADGAPAASPYRGGGVGETPTHQLQQGGVDATPTPAPSRYANPHTTPQHQHQHPPHTGGGATATHEETVGMSRPRRKVPPSVASPSPTSSARWGPPPSAAGEHDYATPVHRQAQVQAQMPPHPHPQPHGVGNVCRALYRAAEEAMVGVTVVEQQRGMGGNKGTTAPVHAGTTHVHGAPPSPYAAYNNANAPGQPARAQGVAYGGESGFQLAPASTVARELHPVGVAAPTPTPSASPVAAWGAAHPQQQPPVHDGAAGAAPAPARPNRWLQQPQHELPALPPPTRTPSPVARSPPREAHGHMHWRTTPGGGPKTFTLLFDDRATEVDDMPPAPAPARKGADGMRSPRGREMVSPRAANGHSVTSPHKRPSPARKPSPAKRGWR